MDTKASSSRGGDDISHEKDRDEEEEDINRYLPMYKAALKGDWESAETFLALHPKARTAKLTLIGETALQIAVGTGHSSRFVRELVNSMRPGSLEVLNRYGETALSIAAIVGNTKAAEILVNKNRNLPHPLNTYGNTPLHRAAQYGHKETVRFLLSTIRYGNPSQWAGELGLQLLNFLIIADFYDVALDVLRIYPNLAIGRDKYGATALQTLAEKSSAFKSGCKLSFWQQLIYPCLPVDVDDSDRSISQRKKDMESNPTEGSHGSAQTPTQSRGIQINSVCRKWNAVLWNAIKGLAPSIKQIHDKKLMHKQSSELLAFICEQVSTLSSARASEFLSGPMFLAAASGIPEFVTHIIKCFPYSIWYANDDSHNIFHLAVLFRQERIFNLIYQMSSHKHFLPQMLDNKGNNILHLAGHLAPISQINSVSGAAFQMQRELQWFQEVAKIVKPSYKEDKNRQGKTPRMVFSEAHKELVKEGEKWMKDTASSCMVVSTLIATMLFSAAFNVPGGKDSNQGIPIFLGKTSFMVFAVSDALGLFSSATSILMFLSILTSRYAEEDFLEALPNRLIIGLIALFFSIATMVTACSATLFIVLSHRLAWVAIPVASLACVPVALFALLQFPLLVKMTNSTYRPKIFYQQSKEIIISILLYHGNQTLYNLLRISNLVMLRDICCQKS